MSLLSAFILPRIEKELIALEPEVANYILAEVHDIAFKIIQLAETKWKAAANVDPKSHEEEE